MSYLDGLRHRLYVLFKGDAYDDEIRRELRVHQDLDALARQRSLGNETYCREEVRRMTILSWFDRIGRICATPCEVSAAHQASRLRSH